MSRFINGLTPKQEKFYRGIGAIMLVMSMIMGLFAGPFSFNSVYAQEISADAAENKIIQLVAVKNWIGYPSTEPVTYNIQMNGETINTVQHVMGSGEQVSVNPADTTLYMYADDDTPNIYTVVESGIDGYISTDASVDFVDSDTVIQYIYTFTSVQMDAAKGHIAAEVQIQSQGEAAPVSDVFYISLFDAEGNLVETKSAVLNNAAEKRVVFANLAPGEYTVRETQADGSDLPASFGYSVTDPVDVTVAAGNISSASVINSLIQVNANIGLYVIDLYGNYIGCDAEFGLYNADTDVQIAAVSVPERDGFAEFSNLPIGNYYIQENVAPAGFAADNTKYYFSVTAENDGETIDIAHINSPDGEEQTPIFIHDEGTATIKLIKVDSEDGQPLCGAEYCLYKDGELVRDTPYITDVNGEIVIHNADWGFYQFEESTAPDGYLLNETVPDQFIENYGGSNEYTITVLGEKDPEAFTPNPENLVSTLEMHDKNGSDQCERLTEGEELTLVITIENPSRVPIEDVPVELFISPDTATFKDCSEGEFIDEEYFFTTIPSIDSGETVQVTVTVEVDRINREDYESAIAAIANVAGFDTNDCLTMAYIGELVIHYVDEDGNDVADEVTHYAYPGDDYGPLTAVDVPGYKLVKTEGPLRYEFVQGKIDVSFVYQPYTTSLTISAETVSGALNLPDVEFEVYKDGELYGTYITDSNGNIVIENVPLGTYTLREVTPPAGYLEAITPESTHFAVITPDEPDGVIVVKHERELLRSYTANVLASTTGEDDDWHEELTVPAGTKVFFKVQITNNGEANINLGSLIITDLLYLNEEIINTDFWDTQSNPVLLTGNLAPLETWESGIMSYDTDASLTEDDIYKNWIDIGGYTDTAVINLAAAPEEKVADITITNTAAVDTAKPGDNIVYIVTVTNTGDVEIHNAVIKSNLGGRWIIDSPDDNIIITEDGDIKIGTVPKNGEPIFLKYVFTVPADAEIDSYIDNDITVDADEISDKDIASVKVNNPVSDSDAPEDTTSDSDAPEDTTSDSDAPENITSDTDIPVPDADEDDEDEKNNNAKPSAGNNVPEHKDAPAYTIRKVANVTSAEPGDTVYYTIIVTNTGNCTLSDVDIADTTLGWSVKIPKLETGKTWTSPDGALKYVVPADATGEFRNIVTVDNEKVEKVSESFTVRVLGASAGGGSGNSGNNNTVVKNTNNGSSGNKNTYNTVQGYGPNTGDDSAKVVTAVSIAMFVSGAALLIMIPYMVRRRRCSSPQDSADQ